MEDKRRIPTYQAICGLLKLDLLESQGGALGLEDRGLVFRREIRHSGGTEGLVCRDCSGGPFQVDCTKMAVKSSKLERGDTKYLYLQNIAGDYIQQRWGVEKSLDRC